MFSHRCGTTPRNSVSRTPELHRISRSKSAVDELVGRCFPVSRFSPAPQEIDAASVSLLDDESGSWSGATGAHDRAGCSSGSAIPFAAARRYATALSARAASLAFHFIRL